MPHTAFPPTSTPQAAVDAYLAELRARLRSLPAEQATDIVEEIRSFIHDTAGTGDTISEASISDALNRLGPAATLAARYVTDNLLAGAQRRRVPWTILRAVFHWALLSVKGMAVFFACLVGYSIGASFFIAALVKPFNPKAGLWLIDDDTFSLVLGMTDASPRGHELLGWKLIPIGLALGGGTILLTTHLAHRWIRRYRETRQLRVAVQ